MFLFDLPGEWSGERVILTLLFQLLGTHISREIQFFRHCWKSAHIWIIVVSGLSAEIMKYWTGRRMGMNCSGQVTAFPTKVQREFWAENSLQFKDSKYKGIDTSFREKQEPNEFMVPRSHAGIWKLVPRAICVNSMQPDLINQPNLFCLRATGNEVSDDCGAKVHF